MRLARAFLLIGSFVGVGLPALARADGTQCAQAFEQAQRLRKAGKLLDARIALVTCAQATCPGFIRKDCSEWLPEVERETPSVAVRVLDKNGCDRPDVLVSLDGREAANAARGSSIEVDPGTHEVVVEIDGEKLTETVVVARGERNRVLSLASGTQATCVLGPSTTPPPAATVTPAPVLPEKKARPVPLLTYVLGGIGIAGLGVGGAFSVSGWAQRSSLDDCRGHCEKKDVRDARSAFVVGDLGLGIGVVAVAAATAVYFLR